MGIYETIFVIVLANAIWFGRRYTLLLPFAYLSTIAAGLWGIGAALKAGARDEDAMLPFIERHQNAAIHRAIRIANFVGVETCEYDDDE